MVMSTCACTVWGQFTDPSKKGGWRQLQAQRTSNSVTPPSSHNFCICQAEFGTVLLLLLTRQHWKESSGRPNSLVPSWVLRNKWRGESRDGRR